jgi:AcrR family transcriptional regulator
MDDETTGAPGATAPGTPRTTGGLRARARAETTAKALEIAARQLGEVGAAGLSVRAVARELGMASSAIYRYFPSRDALLTRLILDAYVDLGAAATAGEAQVDRADHAGRFRATARAARRWALAEPHRYALLYGSPVPGYAAPADTVAPALTVALLLLSALEDAAEAGVPLRRADLSTDLRRELLEAGTRVDTEIDPGVLALGIQAWTALFGHVSFELFGHLHRVVESRDAWFDQMLDDQLRRIGLPG